MLCLSFPAPSAQGEPSVILRNGSTTISWPASSTSASGPINYRLFAISTSFSVPTPRFINGLRFPGLGYAILNTTLVASPISNIRMNFQTYSTNAVLLFASDRFAASKTIVQIVNGRLEFIFDFGRLPNVIRIATANVSDGLPHEAVVVRNGLTATLSLDSVHQSTLTDSTSSSSVMPIASQVFIGGMSSHAASLLPSGSVVNTQSLTGCLLRLQLNSAMVDFIQDITSSVNVLSSMFGCQATPSRGIHFLGGRGGYALHPSNPLVQTGGTTFTLRLSIRTIQDNGLLVYSGNSAGRDFIALQLVSRQLQFLFDNGGGPGLVSTNLQPQTLNICDGRWHSIVVQKAGASATVVVDGGASFSGSATSFASNSADVSGGVYIGGLPESYSLPSSQGVSVRYFSGCLRDVYLSGVQLQPTEVRFARLDGCPDVTPAGTCQSYYAESSAFNPKVVYSGDENQATLPTSAFPPAAGRVMVLINGEKKELGGAFTSLIMLLFLKQSQRTLYMAFYFFFCQN